MQINWSAGSVLRRLDQLGRPGLGAPLLLIIMLCMMVVPLRPFALDALFTFNIALALIVLMATVYAARPLDFAAFPTVLLVATLLRLALNVASTRVVLLEGHAGADAAGRVIEAFGAFVVGGSYAVGLVVFAILVIINFVVVTKGAGRVSEVSARFTLDAMPGKQMAIDADLNAGLISQEEAKVRRRDVSQEADFYGAMDGASKFVRGDAIAGILILLINLIGGLMIGTLQHELSFEGALHNYALLTIGDGLVAQIPSLLLSTAAAIMVTRVSTTQDMGQQILSQLFEHPRTLAVTAGVIGAVGLVPGMPNVAFLGLAGMAGGGAYWLHRKRYQQPAVEVEASAAPAPRSPELGWEDVAPVDPLGLEIGYRLIPLVDGQQGGQLMERIRGVRKKASQELGFLIPPVHIRDNLDLSPNGYRLSLMGVTVGEAEVFPARELAINPGEVFGELTGEPARDPVFNLEAMWIEPTQREQAQALGYTTVDASTVMATHLSELLKEHAWELFGHEEAQRLLDRLSSVAPKLAEELVPKTLPLSVIVKVLQNLLRDGVPIRDMRTIAESMAEHAPKSQDSDVLTAAARIALGRFITQHVGGSTGEIPILTLDSALDHILHQAVKAMGTQGNIALEPGLAGRLQRALAEAAQRQELAGEPALLVVSDMLRSPLARMARHSHPALRVLALSEIPDDKQVRIVATVGREDALGDARASP
jgi:flagellar biosynthesis protein FlhA